MKSMLVIGLGDFGHHLCRHLLKMKNEVLCVDQDESALEDLRDVATSCLIADCTSASSLQRLGIRNFDVCFVCIGKDFKSNLIIVDHLKNLGAKYIVSQTDDSTLAKFLLNNGADEIIHPNSDSAMRAAVKYSSEHIFDYLRLKDGYSIYEITPLKAWIGKDILSAKIKDQYNTYVVGIYHADGHNTYMPRPSQVIEKTDRLMVLAHESTMEELLKKMEQ